MMKVTLRLFCVLGILTICLPRTEAAPATNQPTGFHLTIELQDGSRIIGKSADPAYQFHSDVVGEMKLLLERIRSIECSAKTNSAQLTTTNGDTLTVQWATKEVRVETAFGNFKLPANLIKRVQIFAIGKPVQMRPGLVALWSGEGDGNDSVGSNHAMLTDIAFAEGEVGQAFSLNGFSSYMRIPYHGSLNVGGGEGLTISVWFQPSNIAGLHPIWQWTMPGPTPYGVTLRVARQPGDQGVIYGDFIDADGSLHELTSLPGMVVNGRFQHVALTYDKSSGQALLYLNGVIVAQARWNRPVPFSSITGDFWIGRRDPANDYQGSWTYNRFFAGLLDELAIYDRALSASEIQAICEEENNAKPLPPPQPNAQRTRSFERIDRNFIQN
jgi:hypothetical protein